MALSPSVFQASCRRLLVALLEPLLQAASRRDPWDGSERHARRHLHAAPKGSGPSPPTSADSSCAVLTAQSGPEGLHGAGDVGLIETVDDQGAGEAGSVECLDDDVPGQNPVPGWHWQASPGELLGMAEEDVRAEQLGGARDNGDHAVRGGLVGV